MGKILDMLDEIGPTPKKVHDAVEGMVRGELDEVTATAMCVAIHNHIEMMKQWERKLRLPYYNINQHPNIYRLTPTYPKPTTQSVANLIAQIDHAARELGRIGYKEAAVIDTEKM